MRDFTTLLLPLATAAFLAACSGDQPTPTAPSVPSFSIAADHDYRIALQCSRSAGGSSVFINDAVTLGCGQSDIFFGEPTGFRYITFVLDNSFAEITRCSGTANSPGRFRCKSQKWAATLIITDVGASG